MYCIVLYCIVWIKRSLNSHTSVPWTVVRPVLCTPQVLTRTLPIPIFSALDLPTLTPAFLYPLFSVEDSIICVVVDYTFSFWDTHHKYCGLLSSQNTENKANLPLQLDIQKTKAFQLQGVSPPWFPDQGLCLWTRWGLWPRLPLYRVGHTIYLLFQMTLGSSSWRLITELPSVIWNNDSFSPDGATVVHN